MKTLIWCVMGPVLVLGWACGSLQAAAVGTAWLYQGQLRQNG